MMIKCRKKKILLIPIFVLIMIVFVVRLLLLPSLCQYHGVTSESNNNNNIIEYFSFLPTTIASSTATTTTKGQQEEEFQRFGLPSLEDLTMPKKESLSSKSLIIDSSCPSGLIYRKNKIINHNNNHQLDNDENESNNNNNDSSDDDLSNSTTSSSMFLPANIQRKLQKQQGRRSRRRIPKIVHQTSKSRCLTEDLHEVSKQWEFPGWSYYFHDDEAIMKLLTLSINNEATDSNNNNTRTKNINTNNKDLQSLFPHLKIVAENCLVSGTVKADLWRYVVLWYYGGIYVDIDSAPHKFNESTIQDDDDGFFVVEQYHILSQYFMAISPRHPLMYYSIMRTLLNLLELPDTGKLNAAYVTGPHALHAGYLDFRADGGVKVDKAGRGHKPVWRGIFNGTNNRSIRVEGVGENENEYVWRSKVKGRAKLNSYKRMGMEHFDNFKDDDKKTNSSCLTAILRSNNNNNQMFTI